MSTRNVVLTPHHEALIERLVTSGRYQNASEVLRAGLRELERQDGEYEAKLAVLRAAIQEGIDDIAAGNGVAMESDEAIEDWVADALRRALAPAEK